MNIPIKGEKLFLFFQQHDFLNQSQIKRGSFGKKTWQISVKMKELLQIGSKKCKRG